MKENAFQKAIRTAVEQRIADVQQQKVVAYNVMQAFSKLRKKPLADLDKRVADFQKQVEVLSKNISVRFERDTFVVSATGSSDFVLNQLRRGSDWYEPEPEIDNIITAALFGSQKST